MAAATVPLLPPPAAVRDVDAERVLAHLRPGDHVCSLYQTEDEYLRLLTAFAQQGVERGEKVMCFSATRTPEALLAVLRSRFDCADAIARGQLATFTTAGVYLQGGSFEPQRMIARLEAERDRALAEGYPALRVTGEMLWALDSRCDPRLLVEYETRLNTFFKDSRCLALCQYHRGRFPSPLLLKMLTTHPLTVVGAECFDNFYYQPPEELLGDDVDTATLERRIGNLRAKTGLERELRQARDEWETTFNCLSDPLSIHDPDFNIVLRNRAFDQFFGAPAGNGHKCYEIVHRMDHAPEFCPLPQTLQSRSRTVAEQFEPVVQRHLAISTDPICDGEGNVARVVHVVRDITELKHVHDELERMVRQRTAALEQANAVANKRIKETAALYAVERLLQEDDQPLPEITRRLVALLPRAWQYPECAVARIRFGDLEAASGSFENVVWSHGVSFTASDGTSGEIAVAYRDALPAAATGPFLEEEERLLQSVTERFSSYYERRRAEDAVYKSEASYRSLFEAANDAILVFDPDSEIIHAANGKACAIYGFTAAELLGHSLRSLTKDVPRGEEQIQKLLHDGACHNFETVHRRKDGRELHILASSSVVEYGGRPAILSINRDITELKHLEQQLRHAQKMEAVGRLAGGVAHDFNNLLMVIHGYGEMLLERLPADDPGHKMAGEIQQAAERAAGVTSQLLAFSRKRVVQPIVLDLNAAVRRIESMLQRLLGEDVELVFRLEPSTWPIKADTTQVDQLLMNLAINARDAMPEGGQIVITTGNAELGDNLSREYPYFRHPGDYVHLAVHDTGCGMTPEVQAHLFEPFFTTKDTGKGTGLGLATVYGIVKQGGGHIWVESAPGKGSTFNVYLPRAREPVLVPNRPAKPALRPHAGETVLLVEDSEPLRNLLGELLHSGGYQVLAAADGGVALDLARARAGRLDLLLTDVVMPGLSGPEVAGLVRRVHPEIKVLYISGYNDRQLSAVDAQDSRLLQKPFSRETLMAQVREVLSAPAASLPA